MRPIFIDPRNTGITIKADVERNITHTILKEIPRYEPGQAVPSYLCDISQVLGFFMDTLLQTAPSVFTIPTPFTLNKFDWHLSFAIYEYHSNDVQRWTYTLQIFVSVYGREQLGRELWKAAVRHSLTTDYAKFLIRNNLLHWRLIDDACCDS